MDEIFFIKSKIKLIVHTNQESQFTSENYYLNLVRKYEKVFNPSMSFANTPTDNSVAERFMRTFKEHQINGTTFEQELNTQLSFNQSFKSFRIVLNKYIRSLNRIQDKKTDQTGPNV
jgi:transposase InsO family protein